MVDYVDEGNRIMFDYLIQWSQEFAQTKVVQKYNLMILLVRVFNLFKAMPPITMDELFGGPVK